MGIIGIGLVGTAVAERLLASGYSVVGFDVRSEQLDTLQALGGETACCASAVASACERIILSLPTSAIVRSVLDEIQAELQPGSILIDTTTGDPEDAVGFASMLAPLGVDYVDSTVGGSSRQVRTREAIFLCGASQPAFARCRDLFEQFCKQAFHVGPPGSGARIKLVLNLVLGLNRAVLAEGLEFARASGIDPNVALEILKAGPAYSKAMDTKGARMIAEEFEPEARLSQHLKDVRLILAAGDRQGAHLPLSRVHLGLLEAAELAGFGAMDNSAVIKAFQNVPHE
ncbi:NAD(P)-dependent oxidoreductase [uncultured Paludibaculum sp.]|uniref:NAD(P)-dependent oxidoreductase n=1 Tax=uncultured Paludibaculum sp. TaxID=1765020 RepID=UPI002AAB22B2|nr:NAD(P)-dependent oxidoreductase [uncultured Paludibaculum sp.]